MVIISSISDCENCLQTYNYRYTVIPLSLSLEIITEKKNTIVSADFIHEFVCLQNFLVQERITPLTAVKRFLHTSIFGL